MYKYKIFYKNDEIITEYETSNYGIITNKTKKREIKRNINKLLLQIKTESDSVSPSVTDQDPTVGHQIVKDQSSSIIQICDIAQMPFQEKPTQKLTNEDNFVSTYYYQDKYDQHFDFPDPTYGNMDSGYDDYSFMQW